MIATLEHAEAPLTLDERPARALRLVDQLGMWGNLGVSLLGFTGAIFVLQPGGPGTPELSLAAGLAAIVAGTLLGTIPIALAGLPGTRTGAPAMVLLRGLFGARLSYLPTAVNILQCLGWGVFELVTIATAAHAIAPALPRGGYVLIAGAITYVSAGDQPVLCEMRRVPRVPGRRLDLERGQAGAHLARCQIDD